MVACFSQTSGSLWAGAVDGAIFVDLYLDDLSLWEGCDDFHECVFEREEPAALECAVWSVFAEVRDKREVLIPDLDCGWDFPMARNSQYIERLLPSHLGRAFGEQKDVGKSSREVVDV